MKLAIVVGSTRENRVSDRQAKWLKRVGEEVASEHKWELVDLKEFDLPFMTEPLPPMAGQRPELNVDTQKYLQVMGEADGFILVTPEYNHGTSAVLKNAIDLLDYQFIKKPVAIASHGVVGGARANEQVRLVVNSNLGAVPIPASITFSDRVAEHISDDGTLAKADEAKEASAKNLVEELVWYADALKTARQK